MNKDLINKINAEVAQGDYSNFERLCDDEQGEIASTWTEEMHKKYLSRNPYMDEDTFFKELDKAAMGVHGNPGKLVAYEEFENVYFFNQECYVYNGHPKYDEVNAVLLQLHEITNLLTFDYVVRPDAVGCINSIICQIISSCFYLSQIKTHQITEKADSIADSTDILMIDDVSLSIDDLDEAINAIRNVNPDATIVVLSITTMHKPK